MGMTSASNCFFDAVSDRNQASPYFSSVLRVSTPGLHMWTHYDVMDNVLVQVVGEKFITLLPPDQIEALQVPPGIHQSSSPILNIFAPFNAPFGDVKTTGASIPPALEDALVKHGMTEMLKPGDILFIPALWFHNVFAMPGPKPGPVISINVFWRHFPVEEYDRKDLYGNKDILKASDAHANFTKALQQIDAIGRDRLSEESARIYRRFYLLKLKMLLDQELQKA
jgi:hypothetical protein